MRLISATVNDIRFQAKYGFYFLYAFMTILYVVILTLVPGNYKIIAASIILLTDPAALGFFFIGGIWLLEKGEGIHKFYSISPLRPIEYCLAKTLSLGLISTLAGVMIAVLGLPSRVDILMLAVGMFIGSGFFTIVGLILSTYARSVNHYMLINIIPGAILVIPAMLTAFGVENIFLELFPATILWRVIENAITDQGVGVLSIPGLTAWFCIAAWVVNRRIPVALQSEGGEKSETNSETV